MIHKFTQKNTKNFPRDNDRKSFVELISEGFDRHLVTLRKPKKSPNA